jgi:hypothetical protein
MVMRRVLIAVALVFGLMIPLTVWAQENEHVEVGVFANYFRLNRNNVDLNFAGLGGRVGFNVHRNVQIEAEMAYDFERAFNNEFHNGDTFTTVRSKTRILHGLFGPKFQAGSDNFRVFATGKVGLISFSTTNQNVTEGFEGALGAVNNGDSKFAVYPGGGIEGFIGPIGIRLEAGDEIYFDHGARNNLRVSAGPTFRF